MPSRAPCAGGCGKRVQITAGTRPAGEATCQQCRRLGLGPTLPASVKLARRRARQAARLTAQCETCGRPCRVRYCSRECIGVAMRVRPGNHEGVVRRQREAAAPGLTQHERAKLLRRWRRQGRPCTYCLTRRADTVDHVVPLILGGSNYEGNLVPCCRRCNGRKAGRLVIEWRTGRRCATVHPLPWVVPTSRKPRPKPAPVVHEPVLTPCALPGCDQLAQPGRRYCSHECMWEYNARANRDRYRHARGLPVDPYAPTSKYGQRVA